MNDSMSFEKLLEEHLKRVNKTLTKSSEEILKRAREHDRDKLDNDKIYSVYKEYFPGLKKLRFGTEAYKNYELEHFDEVHQMHAQNRHHYYSHRNTTVDPNLFDVLEAIIDISESSKQYGTGNYKTTLKNKGLYDYSLEDIINNTLEFLDNEVSDE